MAKTAAYVAGLGTAGGQVYGELYGRILFVTMSTTLRPTRSLPRALTLFTYHSCYHSLTHSHILFVVQYSPAHVVIPARSLTHPLSCLSHPSSLVFVLLFCVVVVVLFFCCLCVGLFGIFATCYNYYSCFLSLCVRACVCVSVCECV